MMMVRHIGTWEPGFVAFNRERVPAVEWMTADDMRAHAVELVPLIRSVLERRESLHLFGMQDVWDRMADGRWQCWGALDQEQRLMAFCATTIEQYPLARALYFLLIAGQQMRLWLPQIERIHGWARERGCAVSQIYGRKGWTRALARLGYRHEVDVLRAKL